MTKNKEREIEIDLKNGEKVSKKEILEDLNKNKEDLSKSKYLEKEIEDYDGKGNNAIIVGVTYKSEEDEKNKENQYVLVAATEAKEKKSIWYDKAMCTQANNWWNGKKNTKKILETTNNDDITAAAACRDIGEDWYLPARNELNTFYENLYKKDKGGFQPTHYWSSTETNSINAQKQNFDHGLQYNGDKKYNSLIRCASRF